MSLQHNQDVDLIEIARAVKSTSSQEAQAKEELCAEQEGMMREWITVKMPEKLLPYFKNVKNAWDRTEVLLSCIRDLNYKDIILKPTIDEFSDDLVYEPYFKLNTLAGMLGYTSPKDLYNTGKPLSTHVKYILPDLISKRLHRGASHESIIPAHLNDKTDRNRNNYIYIDVSACEDLISAAMKQSKFREKAKEFKRCFDDIKGINDLLTTIINKEMINYVNKLNTGSLPTPEDRKMINTICAVKSTSSQEAQAKEELCAEQEGMMREWIISKLPQDTHIFFEGVVCPWNPIEFLSVNIKKYGFNDIIMIPTKNKLTGKVYYEPYFAITRLAKYLHYPNAEHASKLLKNHILSTITDPCIICRGEIIVPDHLKTNQLNQMKFGDFKCAKQLIEHVAYSNIKGFAKGKPIAESLLNVMTDLSVMSKDLIEVLNQLISEYRYQQQVHTIGVTNDKLIAYEAAKAAQEVATKELEAKQKRIEEETKLFALRVHPDVDIKKTHYGYIFSSDDYMKKDLYKIGITDNLKHRERDAHTYHPNGGFLYTIETYNAKITEYSLHQILKECRLQYKINSGDEWFKIPGLDEAKKLLNLAINNTDTVYEHVITYPSQLRNRIINPVPIPTLLAIMPNIDPVPTDEFILEVANLVGYNKPICKTNLLKKIKELINTDKYKKYKTKLPTDYETFKTHASTTSNRVNINVSVNGRITAIKFNIEVANNTNNTNNTNDTNDTDNVNT